MRSGRSSSRPQPFDTIAEASSRRTSRPASLFTSYPATVPRWSAAVTRVTPGIDWSRACTSDEAQAILHKPEVLILDEPTAGLDPKQIIETRQLIKELGGDHTIILSTHILPEVSQTCQRVVIINKGRVVAVDTPDNLTARLRGSETMYVQVDAPASSDVQARLQ